MSKVKTPAKKLAHEEVKELLRILKSRFDKNIHRHKGIDWAKVQSKLESNSEKFRSLYEMEQTGGEPDVVSYEKKTDEYIIFDCSPESPSGRRSLCYDGDALAERKENKPENSAVAMAEEMGIELLTEEEYRFLQTIGKFDLKTSSWVKTPERIRKLGGAVFCDRRYDTVFTYHNGASSYYAARGFRGSLRI